MEPSKKILWKIYTAVLATATTMAAQKAIHGAWKIATGDEPPEPNDPTVPITEALIWALASGVGLGLTQLITNRFAARRWSENIGGKSPKALKVQLKI